MEVVITVFTSRISESPRKLQSEFVLVKSLILLVESDIRVSPGFCCTDNQLKIKSAYYTVIV